MTLIDIVKRVEKYTFDNSPSICTAIGVVGTVSTAYLAGKASYDASRKILATDPDATIINKVKLVWPMYIPSVFTGGITIAAIVGANRIGSRRAAAVAAAYSISEKAFAEYKEKIVEKIGPRKEEDVRASIAKDRVESNPVGEFVISGSTDVLCCDSMSGRYFASNVDKLRRAAAETNQQILSDNYAALSDFYSRIGLSQTSLSSEVGWNVDKLLDLKFSTVMADNDRPCIYLEYMTAPIRGYYRLH